MRAAAAEHLVRGFDPNAVGRAAVGHPPRALIEPDLAMSPTRILAIDDDVAGFAAADDVTPSGHNRRQRHVTTAVRIVDFDLERSAGKRRARACE